MKPTRGQVKFGSRARAREQLLSLSCAVHGLYRLVGRRNQMTCGRCGKIKSPRALYLSPIPGTGAPKLDGWFSIKVAGDNRREADYLPTCRSCLTYQAWKGKHVGRKQRRRGRVHAQRREAPKSVTTTRAPVPPAAPSTGNETLPPGIPAVIDGSKVVEVEQNWRFVEKGKPPVADGWKVTLADGKCGIVRPNGSGHVKPAPVTAPQATRSRPEARGPLLGPSFCTKTEKPFLDDDEW